MTNLFKRERAWLCVALLLCVTWIGVGCPGVLQDPGRFFRDGVPIAPDANAPADRAAPPADNPPADRATPVDNAPPADRGNPADTTPPADRGTPPADRGQPPKGCDPAPLFQKKCNFCHGDNMPSAALSLTGDATALFAKLKEQSSKCAGSKIIDTSDVLKSVFWVKVAEEKANQCKGGRMPVGGKLNATELDCIKQWLQANAGN